MTQSYNAAVTALGGRSGFATSSDGRLKVELSIPAVLGGDNGAGTNPEQLFAAAQASSLLAAIREVASGRGVEVPADGNVTATVRLDGERQLSVAVAVDLPCIDIGEARQIVTDAMRICPIALATGERIPAVVNVD